MSIFDKRLNINKNIEQDFIKEKQEIKKICKKILIYKKAKQFLYKNVIEHFNPQSWEDFNKLKELLEKRLAQEEKIYKKLFTKSQVIKFIKLDKEFQNRKSGEELNYSFTDDLNIYEDDYL